MKKALLFGLIVVMLVSLTACAAGPNTLKNTKGDEEKVVGFWRGIWHGFITPFTFIISLFKDSIGIYEAHNNGGWYNFGYILGLMVIFGGSGGGSARRRRRSRKE